MRKIRDIILAGLTCMAITALLMIALFAPTEIWAPWFMLGMGLVAGFYAGAFAQWLCTVDEINKNRQKMQDANYSLNKRLNRANMENAKLKKRVRELEDHLTFSKENFQKWSNIMCQLANDSVAADTDADLTTSGDTANVAE